MMWQVLLDVDMGYCGEQGGRKDNLQHLKIKKIVISFFIFVFPQITALLGCDRQGNFETHRKTQETWVLISVLFLLSL